jgi:hypothetical protein
MRLHEPHMRPYTHMQWYVALRMPCSEFHAVLLVYWLYIEVPQKIHTPAHIFGWNKIFFALLGFEPKPPCSHPRVYPLRWAAFCIYLNILYIFPLYNRICTSALYSVYAVCSIFLHVHLKTPAKTHGLVPRTFKKVSYMLFDISVCFYVAKYL